MKIRSKPQLARYLGESFDLSAFDFRTGKLLSSALRKSKRHKGTAFDFARGLCCDFDAGGSLHVSHITKMPTCWDIYVFAVRYTVL